MGASVVPQGTCFLDAPTHLYKRLCPLVCRLVSLSVDHAFIKTEKNRPNSLRIVALFWRGPQIKVQDQSINELLSQLLAQSIIHLHAYKNAERMCLKQVSADTRIKERESSFETSGGVLGYLKGTLIIFWVNLMYRLFHLLNLPGHIS